MAVTIKPSKNKLIAIIIGVIIAVVAGFIGIQTVFTRAADERPQAVTINNITATGAIINWESGQAVQSAVKLGKGPKASDLTTIIPETEATKLHKVEVTLLEPATTYFFVIVGGSDTEYMNGDSTPWTFTTAADTASIPTSDVAVKRTVTPIQRLVIPDTSSTATSTPINCKTEPNCELIKANFANGCSSSDYTTCTFKNK